MKIFAFFMAILVLVLSVMPCADGASPKGSKISVVTVKKDVNHPETGDDDCSPFCQCACCAGFSLSHPVKFIDFVPAHFTTQFFGYSSNNPAGIAFPIWQPPQLRS